MKGFPDLPPIWWLGSIALIYIVEFAFPSWHFDSAIFDVVSWVILGTAIGIAVWAAFWFWRKKTPIEPHHRPKTLIVEGPYRVSRNPIYLALVMLTTASAIGHGSVFGAFVAIGLWRVLDRRFAAVEEALLRETFGPDAETYLSNTRRWI